MVMPLKAWAFLLVIAGVVVVGIVFRAEIADIFREREKAREWISGRGVLGHLVFVGLQVLQVVVFVIPGGLTQAMGGFPFVFWLGGLLSLLGIAAGFLLNYCIGRILGRPFRHLSRRVHGGPSSPILGSALIGTPSVRDVLSSPSGFSRPPPSLFWRTSSGESLSKPGP